MLFEVGKACRIIDPEDLKSLSDSDKIDFSKITETEIQDKSKSDGLACGLWSFRRAGSHSNASRVESSICR